MEPVVTREQLLAVLAKQLPATISPSELEDGLDMAIELPDERESGSRTSTGTTNTTAFSVHIRSTRLQADSLKRAFKRESSSFLCEDPGSVNSMTGELHYRELFEKMQMAAALHEVIVENGVVVDTRFKDINPYFCKLFGLDREEIVGHRMTQIFPGIEDDKANWIANFGRTGLEGRTFEFNTFSQHLGQWYAGVAYRPDPSRTDFCCVFVDSSKDVNHQVELEESEERHRNLFECMGQGVVYQDADGQIIMANPAAERILGLTVDQMRGRQSIDPRWRAMRADGSDFPGEEHPSMVALRTGEKQLNVIMGVYHPGEDSHHWIKVDAIPRFHKGSTRPYQVYGTFTDITDDKRSSEALLIAKEEAQRADALKSSFLANMSHEIRTPLNGIMGYIDLALSNRLSVDHQQENIEGLQIAKCSGELLLSIIEDILDISKIEAGALELEDEVFSLQEVFSATTSLAQTLVVQKKKDIRIVSTMCQEISDSIRGDSFRLQQILNNLVSNSAKFTKDGEIHVDIAKGDRGNLMIQVRDTGKGIPETFYETIFEPFRQVELGDTRNHGGTGLGLTISRKLAHMMGGDLQVESRTEGPDHGSCFTLSFPYRPSEIKVAKQDLGDHLEEHRLRRQSTGRLVRTILVVEDDSVSRRMMLRMLEKSGYEAIAARNGQEGVEMYKDTPDIDLILMDVQMPIMDGYDATKRIREEEKRQARGSSLPIPIIALSASAMKGDQERGIAFGMTDYLTKPVNLKVLTATLERYIY